MSDRCRIIGRIIMGLGIIGSIYLAYQYGTVADFEYAGRIYSERDYVKTGVYFVVGCLSSIGLGTIFTGMAEIIDGIIWMQSQEEQILKILNIVDKKLNGEK